MFVKSILATAAIATTLALGAATSAQADPNVNFSFGVGFGYPVYDAGYPSYDEGPDPFFEPRFRPRHRRHHDWNDFPPPPPRVTYGINCGQGRNILRQHGFHNVQAYRCQGPVYGYQAWKQGEFYRVSVNFRGQVVSVDPAY
jgi:hypothetical protein